MGVPANHFVRNCLSHVLKIETPVFFGHACVENDLKEQIAKFIAQLCEVLALDRVRNLIGFFNGVGGNGGEVLLHIPGAAASIDERAVAEYRYRRQ